ncbi:MAG: HlyD family efflux transporter periplasmic adaptor subunit [Desulfovibrio sp.]|uniref:HlyD family secretion protein n=1 Tax=Desulfovibrio sp. TaxID=885 RepID=UPI001A7D3597|nr:HlyD family secretion protein [Desulfovibrio sp.]MBD5417539.1 HlyD family efflux transporter periplasmic adaptor subunit [Desulfovibrio sp.]
MTEALTLELPTAKSSGRWPLRRLLMLLIAVLVLAGAALAWWMYSGRVTSVAARLDGMVHVVAPRFSGHVASLDVKEGDTVAQGQPVGSMEAGTYDRHLAQAAAEAASLRPAQGPDMVESAGRLRQAQEAERDFAVRMAQARNEEDRLRLLREERVTEHVRAQLALRGLDSQGGERTAGKEKYAAAREAEAMARSRKEAAAADFERASLMRAALEQELERIRQEVMAARNHASQQRQNATRSALPEQLSADGTLYAPVGGTVLRRMAEPGQLLQAGEPALFIAPAGAAARDAFWVDAWFPAGDANSIRAGQRCSIRIGQASVSGSVREVLPPQPLPEGLGAAPQEDGSAASMRRPVAYIPVRIALSGELPRGISPGSPAECTVMTHGLSF